MNATTKKGESKMITAKFVSELFPMIDSGTISATEAAQHAIDMGWNIRDYSPQSMSEMSYWDVLAEYKKLTASDCAAEVPTGSIELVTCSCGCEVPRALVMNSSMGTSCPDCYDRMSD
jgi:hypothetical protein